MKKYNIKIKRGTDFLFSFRIKDKESDTIKDLTGYSGNMRIKDKYSGTGIGTGTVTITAENVVQCAIDKAGTTAMPAGVAVYDISLTDADNKTIVVFYGEVEIMNNANI